jgi:hypothetical protein
MVTIEPTMIIEEYSNASNARREATTESLTRSNPRCSIITPAEDSKKDSDKCEQMTYANAMVKWTPPYAMEDIH